MFVIFLISLYNAVLSSESVVNPARISIGVAKIGANEIVTVLVFLYALFKGGDIQMRYPRLRMHPLIGWIIGLWIIAWIAGALGSIGSLIPSKELMVAMREYASVPVYIFAGYRLLGTPRDVYRLPYILIFAGVANATALMIRFASGAKALLPTSENINALRQIEYPTIYAVVAVGLLMYSVLSGVRIVRSWIAIPLTGYCLVGALSAVSRTTAVVIGCVLIAICVVMPRGKSISALVKLVVVTPLIIVALNLGVLAAGKVTGRDFYRVVERQIESLTPRDEDSTNTTTGKAWDTRLPSIFAELEIFSHNPLIGQGFGGVADYVLRGGTNWGAFGHNSFTGIMAATGLVGLIAMVLTSGVPLVGGYRMVKDEFDHSTVVMGAVSYIVGVTVFVCGMCTMIFYMRTAMYFGVFCGVAIRAREIQETMRAMQAVEDYEYGETELPHGDGQGYNPVPGF